MPGCLEPIRENTEPGSALAFSLTLQAMLSRMGLPALQAVFLGIKVRYLKGLDCAVTTPSDDPWMFDQVRVLQLLSW